ncbi:hypothetical protein K2V03_002128 [Listeria innocua]|nr:hypothetical protein [Listeria innocua]EIU0523718.1 hypothetical protein [Listeria innocua]
MNLVQKLLWFQSQMMHYEEISIEIKTISYEGILLEKSELPIELEQFLSRHFSENEWNIEIFQWNRCPNTYIGGIGTSLENSKLCWTFWIKNNDTPIMKKYEQQ